MWIWSEAISIKVNSNGEDNSITSLHVIKIKNGYVDDACFYIIWTSDTYRQEIVYPYHRRFMSQWSDLKHNESTIIYDVQIYSYAIVFNFAKYMKNGNFYS